MNRKTLLFGFLLATLLLSCTKNNNTKIYEKNSNGDEIWYAEKGNISHGRSWDGVIWSFECDKNGKVIYETNSEGDERWYDRKGKILHSKNNNDEVWYKYNSGKLIYEKTEYFKPNVFAVEIWYDKKERMSYAKSTTGIEIWYEYDRKGNISLIKLSDGKETWYSYYGSNSLKKISDGTETWYENYCLMTDIHLYAVLGISDALVEKSPLHEDYQRK